MSCNVILNTYQRKSTFLPESVREEEGSYVCLSLTPPATFYVVIAYRKSSILSKPVKNLIKLLLKACETT